MLKQLVKRSLGMLMHLLFRLRVEGDLTGLDSRRLLIIANHESFLDGLLLGVSLPVDAVFVVHTGVTRNPLFRLMLSLVDYYAVDPTNPMAMKTIVKLVESGRPVVIFPEGRITTTGSLMKVYDGPAFVAAKTGADVVPVRLDGPARSYFARTSGDYPHRLFPRISLTVLPKARIALAETGKARDRRRQAGESMRRLMQEMVFSSHPISTLYSGFIDAMEIHGRQRRVLEDMKQIEYSYGDLLKMTLALGRAGERVSRPGEAVGLLLPNVAATLALMLGLSARGRVPAMLNYTAGAEGLRNACAAGRIATVICARKFVETAKLEPALAGLEGIRLLWLEDLAAGIGVLDKLWVLAASRVPRWVEALVKPGDPAVVLFTSGSEGKPKGVVLSHRALLANVAQVLRVIPVGDDEVVLNALPIFHSFGLTAGTLIPLVCGARLILYTSPLHFKIIPQLVREKRCTVMFGTGTFFNHYARNADPGDMASLKYVVAGAEKLGETVRQLWREKFNVDILEGYGATETAPVLAVNRPRDNRPGSVGRLLPGVEARILPVPGIEQGGELHVRGPNIMSGYYRFDAPGVLEPPVSDAGPGWYNTGDVVDLDADGLLTIQGRLKRFAKVAGEMVSLEIVEAIARSASEEAMHAATCVADEGRGELIILFTTDSELTREQLAAAARGLGYPEIALPRRIRVVDKLPLLGTGKVDYVRLKQHAHGT